METMPIYTILYFSFFFFSTFLHPSLSELCHPEDKEVLLQIKRAFDNPKSLISWDPETDCCDWEYVDCGQKSNRIISLRLNSMKDLTGRIPLQIGNLPYLENLDFSNHPNLVGPIPPTIGKLTMLRFLLIISTNVSGPIPSIIGHLKKLEFLDLSSNSLSGQIPCSIGWLPNLGGLRVDRNKLSGRIPESFGDFKRQDFYLYMSHNRISGKIPVSLKKKDFTYVDLSWNQLKGDASPLFVNKKSMELLDLAGNMLKFDLSKVDIPRSLISLDLRHNKLFGSLPKGLTELKSLKNFNVSYNRLCGKIPVGGNLQKFGESAYVHNICLCGLPLQSCESQKNIFTLLCCWLRCFFSRFFFSEVTLLWD